MPNASSLRKQAAAIASASTNPDVQALARIVEQLAVCVGDAEHGARGAQEQAQRASRDATNAKRDAKR